MKLSSEEARRLVETAHRLEGWSGNGDSEEEVRRMGDAAAKDPAGVFDVAGRYLTVLMKHGVGFMWDGQRLRFMKASPPKQEAA